MGVFNKLKNIFYDEEIVDEDDNKEIEREEDGFTQELEINKPKVEEIKVIKQETIAPEIKIEEKPKVESSFNERDLFRNERVFSFTELDDEEEVVLPPRKSVTTDDVKINRSFERPVSEPVLEQPKVFKPSPVISPIYGILDKDYKKEEITTRKEEPLKNLDNNASRYDTVRRKAYGTLEDELEDTLNSMNKITSEEVKKEEEKIVTREEIKPKNNLDDIIEKMEKDKSSVSVGELEDKLELEHFDDEEDDEENIDKTMTDSTLEHDLFNLIDSMYDDKEE